MPRTIRTSGKARKTPEERLIAAALATAVDGRWRRATLGSIARRARVKLDTAKTEFRNSEDVLDVFSTRIDEAAMTAVEPDELAAVPAKERLLELFLCRLDELTPHKVAMHNLAKVAKESPVASYRALCRVEQSMGTILDHAKLSGSSRVWREVRMRVLAVIWLRAFQRWLDADGSGNEDSVLADLDRDLRRLDEFVSRFLSNPKKED